MEQPKKMTFEEKLIDQIARLKREIPLLEARLNELKGGLMATEGLLNEYKNNHPTDNN